MIIIFCESQLFLDPPYIHGYIEKDRLFIQSDQNQFH